MNYAKKIIDIKTDVCVSKCRYPALVPLMHNDGDVVSYLNDEYCKNCKLNKAFLELFNEEQK